MNRRIPRFTRFNATSAPAAVVLIRLYVGVVFA
jgi:hypothetical protein